MNKFFESVGPIGYEGPDSENPLAFRHYDKDRVVLGKTMADHLRFAVCYWHTFCWPGTDPFGSGTLNRPWMSGGDALCGLARRRRLRAVLVRRNSARSAT